MITPATVATHAPVRVRTASHARWLWLGWSVYSLLLGALFVLRPPGPDLSTFDYAGWIANQGGTLYVDVIEQNWPGAIWLHMLANRLFGNHLWAFRVIDYALLLIGSLALYQLARIGGRRATAPIALLLYQALYVTLDIWGAGQRDAIAAQLLLVIGVCQLLRLRGGSAAWPAAIGLGMLLVCLTRPTYATFVVLLYAADAWRARENGRSLGIIARDLSVAGAAFCFPLVLIGLVFYPSGALAGFYRAAILFNTLLYSHSASLQDMLRTLSWIPLSYWWVCLFALVGLVGWWRRGERDVLAVGLSVVATGVISTIAQGKGFGYHLSAAFPSLALFAAECVAWALDRARTTRTPHARALAVLVCLFTFLGIAKKLDRVLRPYFRYVTGAITADALYGQLDSGASISVLELKRAASYARSYTRPDQTVLVWSRAVAINHLAERRLPTPLATIGMLDIAAEQPLMSGWVTQFAETLQKDPPALIYIYNEHMPSGHTRFWGEQAGRATALVRDVLTARYRFAARFGTLDAYTLE